MSGAQFPFFQPQVPHPPTLSDLMASIQRLGRTTQIWTPCQSDAQTFEIFWRGVICLQNIVWSSGDFEGYHTYLSYNKSERKAYIYIYIKYIFIYSHCKLTGVGYVFGTTSCRPRPLKMNFAKQGSPWRKVVTLGLCDPIGNKLHNQLRYRYFGFCSPSISFTLSSWLRTPPLSFLQPS